MPETAPSNYNENILLSAGDCSIQHIVKDKEDCASIPTNSTKINKQIVDYRQKGFNNSIFYRKQQEVKILIKFLQQVKSPLRKLKVRRRLVSAL